VLRLKASWIYSVADVFIIMAIDVKIIYVTEQLWDVVKNYFAVEFRPLMTGCQTYCCIEHTAQSLAKCFSGRQHVSELYTIF
jgi:hypothetical protein